jgi:hypothetical protein
VPTVRDLTAVYENFMMSPRAGSGVCATCFTFTDGYDRCYACAQRSSWLDSFMPISYSVAGEQLHHALAAYKRLTGDVSRRLRAELAAVLWRFLDAHERCAERAAGVESFGLVATVPSGDRSRDDAHPLRAIVGSLVGPTRPRHDRILRRTTVEVPGREFDARKYEAVRPLDGHAVLLIDDTWTTGANVESAAAALKEAGAAKVAAVVIGRHLKRDWRENDRRLRALARPFGWQECALCAQQPG